MRLNNSKKAAYFNFLGTLVMMSLFMGIGAYLLERFKYDYLGISSSLFVIVPVIFALIFYFGGRQIFEYDSDGEALNFKNRNVILFLSKPLSDEFPKYKLKKYEIVNLLIIKRLYITISSKKNQHIMLKYDISYLSNQELQDLKMSLNRVIKANKERAIES